MKVSVITVTYNSVHTLEQTILSVAAQDYPGIEYIIVDGGSTDGTLSLIDRYRIHVSKFISEADEGLYHALNKGISLAEGDVIAFLHSDDFYTGPGVISAYVALFQKQNCMAIYSDLYYVDRYNTDKIIRKWRSGNYRKGSFLQGWMPPHPTFLARKEMYERFGIFNTSLKSAADYELMLRFIHKHQIHICYLPQFTIKMRAGGKSNVSLKNRLAANTEDRRAWAINGLQPKFYTLYLKPLRKLFQFFI